MKSITTYSFILMLLCLVACNNDDDSQSSSNVQQLMGNWELTDGNFFSNETKYVNFSNDGIKFLFEDEMGFKGRDQIHTIENLTETNFIINTQGSITYTYSINGNTLTLTDNVFNATATFVRNDNAPQFEDWITILSREAETATPWENAQDITFRPDSNYILSYNGINGIYQIHINDFNFPGAILPISDMGSGAIADASIDGPFMFHTSTTFPNRLFNYSYNDAVSSVITDVSSPVTSLAMDKEGDINLYVASKNNKKIVRIRSGEVLEYTLTKRPFGIEAIGDFLYISTFEYLHKCQITNTEIRAVETYDVSATGGIYGMTSDGTNLWINTQNSGEEDKLIKTSLTF